MFVIARHWILRRIRESIRSNNYMIDLDRCFLQQCHPSQQWMAGEVGCGQLQEQCMERALRMRWYWESEPFLSSRQGRLFEEWHIVLLAFYIWAQTFKSWNRVNRSLRSHLFGSAQISSTRQVFWLQHFQAKEGLKRKQRARRARMSYLQYQRGQGVHADMNRRPWKY